MTTFEQSLNSFTLDHAASVSRNWLHSAFVFLNRNSDGTQDSRRERAVDPRVNPVCPNCQVKNTATYAVKRDDDRSAIYCPECSFMVSVISESFADVVWAWNAIPRPKAKPRKARRKGK